MLPVQARLLLQSTQPPTLPTGPEEGRAAPAEVGGGVDSGGTSSLVNSGALSLTSSRVMMAEAVAVRPSPDMSATCRLRLYTATTWRDGNMGSGDWVGIGPGLASHCRAWGAGQGAGHLLWAQPTQKSPVGSRGPKWFQAPCLLPISGAKSAAWPLGGLMAPLPAPDSAPVQEWARGRLPSRISIYRTSTACRMLSGTNKLGPCFGA